METSSNTVIGGEVVSGDVISGEVISFDQVDERWASKNIFTNTDFKSPLIVSILLMWRSVMRRKLLKEVRISERSGHKQRQQPLLIIALIIAKGNKFLSIRPSAMGE